ncbi:MAG: protein tyrosine phosphatase [Isosphaeraceae bacterium]
MSETSETPTPRRRPWPWVVLALLLGTAVWHVVDFPTDIDGEYPKVVRPTFSAWPPPSIRLAEPGDTIDRIGLYGSSAALVLAAWGWMRGRWLNGGSRLWPAAAALALAATWHAATPGPTLDGWHGLGWRALFDASAPPTLRVGLAAVAMVLTGVVLATLIRSFGRRAVLWRLGRDRGMLGLLGLALGLVVLRQIEVPGIGPPGYWPRWGFAIGMAAFALALVRALPTPVKGWRRPALLATAVAAWCALAVIGVDLTWYHRPLKRLRTVAPGRIYLSAMPTYRGLEVAQRRHQFKTIINLFPEDTPLRSRYFPEELRFAREHNIHYVRSPNGVARADAFLDKTLALARDPNAWPILVHCHGCMDRAPAWMGIYRFVVQGVPLDAILREIEGHRGYRPKASVTILYNRVLRRLAPEQHADDPTAQHLLQCAEGTTDPFETDLEQELAGADPGSRFRVSRANKATRRP